jgi:hypothetical protein
MALIPEPPTSTASVSGERDFFLERVTEGLVMDGLIAVVVV